MLVPSVRFNYEKDVKYQTDFEKEQDKSSFGALPYDAMPLIFGKINSLKIPGMCAVSKKWDWVINVSFLDKIKNNFIFSIEGEKTQRNDAVLTLPKDKINSFFKDVMIHYQRIIPEFNETLQEELRSLLDISNLNFSLILQICKARDALIFKNFLKNQNQINLILGKNPILEINSVLELFDSVNTFNGLYTINDFSRFTSFFFNKEMKLFKSIISLPEVIKYLKKIECLDLSDNHMLIFPNEIEHLENLRVLTLNFNNLTSIPPKIFKLKQLGVLNLASNPRLTSLPDELWEMNNLTEIDLTGCGISSISEKIGQLKNLKKINLTGNPCANSLPQALNFMECEVILKDDQQKKKKSKQSKKTCIIS